MTIRKLLGTSTLVLTYFFIANSTEAGEIKTWTIPKKGAIRIYEVSKLKEADLVVYRGSQYEAYNKDEVWHEQENYMEMHHDIQIVDDEDEADVKVYFCHDISKAGWRKPSRFIGRFR